MTPKDLKIENLNVNNVFADGLESNVFSKITKSIIMEESSVYVDTDLFRRNEDWGSLAYQVVGSESRS